MAKRLQVILQDSAYREIKRASRSGHMTMAEWVRQALDQAQRREPLENPAKKIAVIRTAVPCDYPSADVDQMLAEIERGYASGSNP